VVQDLHQGGGSAHHHQNTEPEGKEAFSPEFERRLGEGTFALQAHDPDSKVYFRNLKVRRLP
jgi:hypothetical protein